MSVDDVRDELDVEDIEDDAPEIDAEVDDIDDEPEADAEPAEEQLGVSFDEDEEGEDGDPFAGKPAPDWVKELRKENRELKKQVREREAQAPQQQALREKPTLDSYDYDSEAYEADLQQWLAEKQQHDALVQTEQQKYQSYRDRYVQSVDEVRAKVPDYDDIEAAIVDILSVEQQGLLQIAADNPAKMVLSLGASPKTLAKLSKLDAVQFTKQLGILEHNMAQTKSRNPSKPKPDTHELKGGSGGGDTQLAKLEAEAERTGDRSKIREYRKQLKQSK